MATYEELESFVRGIAGGCCDPVLEAKAQLLLGIELAPFNTNMVDSAIYESHRDEDESHFREDMEAMILKYGDQAPKYIMEKLENDGFGDATNEAISWLGHYKNSETLEARRLLLEKLLSESNSPLRCYYILINLMNIKDPKSLPVIEAYHTENKHGKVMFDISQQAIDYLKRDS